MYIRHIFSAAFLFSLLLTGCAKYVDIDPPKNEVAGSQTFADDETAEAAVVGIYTDMNSLNYQFANVMGNIIVDMSADEISYAASFDGFNQFRNNALLPSNSYLAYLWNQPYSLIYQANACIEGLENNAVITPSLRDQLLGEVLFVRSFCYFYLINYFGDVPLITKTDYTVNNVMGRTATETIYDTLRADLKQAIQLLGDDYPNDGQHIRPNKSVAKALAARAALYQKDWATAEQYATDIINGKRYHLLSDLNGVFLKNSDEAIWQLQAVNPGRDTWEGNILVPISVPYYRLDTTLVKSFDTSDLRRKNWIGTYTAGTSKAYYPYKYKVRTNSGDPAEYSMVFRLAEQYLIRAEARAQSGDIEGAMADIDTLRKRAAIANLPATLGQSALLEAVAKERRLELFTEWGHRWLDLKRTGKASSILKTIKTAWADTDTLYPIPLNAIETNASLHQNPGY